MRIIITEQGGNLIKLLSTDKLQEDIRKANSPIKKPKEKVREKDKVRDREKNDKTKSPDMNKLKNSMENLRVLEIKNKKLSIPKDIQEKYNEIKLEESSLLPKLYTNLKKSAHREQTFTQQNIVDDMMNTESTRENTIGGENNTKTGKNPNSSMSLYNMTNANQPFMQTSYRVMDIMTDEALAKMKNRIIEEVKLKNKNANVVSFNFRNPFLTPYGRLREIDEALSTKINSDKSNIIQYINSKDNPSPKFVKNMVKYDEEKFERLNKICQRVFNNKIEENDMKYRINGIIENHHLSNKANYKKQMNIMEKEVNEFKQICQKYPQRDDREKYENLLHDVKKNHWNKYDFQRLMKRGNKNNKVEN
jgi:hypothetical protein